MCLHNDHKHLAFVAFTGSDSSLLPILCAKHGRNGDVFCCVRLARSKHHLDTNRTESVKIDAKRRRRLSSGTHFCNWVIAKTIENINVVMGIDGQGQNSHVKWDLEMQKENWACRKVPPRGGRNRWNVLERPVARLTDMATQESERSIGWSLWLERICSLTGATTWMFVWILCLWHDQTTEVATSCLLALLAAQKGAAVKDATVAWLWWNCRLLI